VVVGPTVSLFNTSTTTSHCDKLAILAPSLSLHVRGNTLRAIAIRQLVHIFMVCLKKF
jgi:hypothetical protein